MSIPQRIPPLARFEAHPVRLQIQDLLVKAAVGDVVTYEQVSAEIGYDVRETPHLLYSAREALCEAGVVFDVVPGVGVKRVADAGALGMAEGYNVRIHGAARRATRVLRTVDSEALTPGERIRLRLAQIRAGIAQQFATRRMAHKMERAVTAGAEPAQLRAAVSKSLEQFT